MWYWDQVVKVWVLHIMVVQHLEEAHHQNEFAFSEALVGMVLVLLLHGV